MRIERQGEEVERKEREEVGRNETESATQEAVVVHSHSLTLQLDESAAKLIHSFL